MKNLNDFFNFFNKPMLQYCIVFLIFVGILRIFHKVHRKPFVDFQSYQLEQRLVEWLKRYELYQLPRCLYLILNSRLNASSVTSSLFRHHRGMG